MTLTLSPEDLAASCYRAWCAAAAPAAPAPWEGLSLENQAPWLKVALRGEQALAACEGKSFREAGAALARLQLGGGDPEFLAAALAAPANRLAYEALARHLMTVLDSETPPDLGALERSWGPWAAGRLEKEEGSRRP